MMLSPATCTPGWGTPDGSGGLIYEAATNFAGVATRLAEYPYASAHRTASWKGTAAALAIVTLQVMLERGHYDRGLLDCWGSWLYEGLEDECPWLQR